MGPAASLTHLQTTIYGLTKTQATHRLRLKGRNVLTNEKPLAWWQLLLQVIPNPFNILLTIIAIISVANPSPEWVSP